MGEVVQLAQCRHGRFLAMKSDAYVGRVLVKYGEYSEAEVMLWKQIVKPGMNAVDVGAYTGELTIPLARMVGEGLVIAVEPQRQLYYMLCGNLALNQIGNVKPMLCGLGASSGEMEIDQIDYAAWGNFGGFSLSGDAMMEIPRHDGKNKVELQTLDHVMAGLPVHFIKIDVEGMELDVIRGAERAIAEHRPIIYVENDRERRSKALIQKLFDLDYLAFWHLAPLFNPTNYNNDMDGDIFANVVSVNMLCIHRSRQMNIAGLKRVESIDEAPHVIL